MGLRGPKPGECKKPAGSGRQPGSGNILSRDVREGIVEAYHRLGGVEWLVGLGTSDPRSFSHLLRAILPRDVTVTGELSLREIILRSLELVPKDQRPYEPDEQDRQVAAG